MYARNTTRPPAEPGAEGRNRGVWLRPQFKRKYWFPAVLCDVASAFTTPGRCDGDWREGGPYSLGA